MSHEIVPKFFGELELDPRIVDGLVDMGFEEPTPIQQLAVPLVLSGHDIIGQAQTGTGKTAAFGIPLCQKIDFRMRGVQAIIITPTRELAIQVGEEISKIGRYRRIRALPIYGGQSIDRQIRSLRQGVQVVVGTPGRLLDHLRRQTLKLEHVNLVILDEADEMLDMGFIDDIEDILRHTPATRQTLLFSATMPEEITRLAHRYMTEPRYVTVSKANLTVPQIEQVFYEAPEKHKLEALCRLLDITEIAQGIVFCRTKRGVDELVAGLQARGYTAVSLHGDLSQQQRNTVMRQFRSGEVELLVATDVAARGLDIEGVSHVINYDIPQDPEFYVHRIGRTGRAGRCTSLDGPDMPRPYPVHRLLIIDPDWYCGQSAARQFFIGRLRREREAVAHLKHLVESFGPHVIFVWHAIGLPRVLLQAAEQHAPSVYYLAGYLPELPDEYIAYWQAQPVRGSARLFKRPLARAALAILRREGKPVRLKYEHVICVSNYVRQRLVAEGLISSSAVVIPNGVNVEHFTSVRPRRAFDEPLALLCAGRLEPDKGVHHVIEALAHLSKIQRDRVVRLDVVGDGNPPYVAHLRSLVAEHDLGEQIRFLPPVERDQMPQLLDAYDVLVQPSLLEALSRMVQEAMAMGLLVIGTTTGGSGELLINEETGLVFEAGNPQSLVEQLTCAVNEPGLAARLAAAGQAQVRQNFRIDQTVSKIEAYLESLVEQSQ